MGGIIHVVGFPKSGTTTLHALLLGSHVVAPGRRKESRFFYEAIETGRVDELDRGAYLRAIGGLPADRWRVDGSPDDVYGGGALAAVLADWFPTDHLVLLVVRDPVERLLSHLRFVISLGILPRDTDPNAWLRAALDDHDRHGPPPYHREPNPGFLLAASRYERFAPPWLDRLGDACAVIRSDDLRVDGPGVVRRMLVDRGLDEVADGIGAVPEANRTTYARNWGVDRLARRANAALEPVWHRFPRTKARLRGAYAAINSRPPDPVRLADDVAHRLEAHYAPTRAWLASAAPTR